MNPQEMCELDVWIAENVFKRWMLNPESLGECPRYTNRPSAALEVLKKCAEKNGWMSQVVIGTTAGGNYFIAVTHSEIDASFTLCTEAETLELAVCLFAKKLFGKGGE